MTERTRKRFIRNPADISKKPLREEDLSNEVLTVKEKEVVELTVMRESDLGYVMSVNGKHIGLLHYNEVFKTLHEGDTLTGFVKKIKENNKIDLMSGKPGHTRVTDESGKIINLLKANKGFLPYHDKSSPESIYHFFGMSKKTFKMSIGNLYRQQNISIDEKGITLLNKKST